MSNYFSLFLSENSRIIKSYYFEIARFSTTYNSDKRTMSRNVCSLYFFRFRSVIFCNRLSPWHWRSLGDGDDDDSVSGRRHDNVFPQRTRPGLWRHATSASASPHQPATVASNWVFLHGGSFRWRHRAGSMNMAMRLCVCIRLTISVRREPLGTERNAPIDRQRDNFAEFFRVQRKL